MIKVHQFPCLKDNYGFLLVDSATNKTACIDSPDAMAIIAQAEKLGLRIDEVWNTHWHPDHAGGNQALKEKYGAKLIGPKEVASHGFPIDIIVGEGEIVNLGQSQAKVIDVSGHTLGHIAYYFEEDKKAFVGDSLFVLGCGRLFEGDAKLAYSNLKKLKALPEETLVYCAHEYSLANAKFCQSLEIENDALTARIIEIEKMREKDLPTVPTKIGIEVKTSPFLLAGEKKLRQKYDLEQGEDWEVFAKVRKAKDNY